MREIKARFSFSLRNGQDVVIDLQKATSFFQELGWTPIGWYLDIDIADFRLGQDTRRLLISKSGFLQYFAVGAEEDFSPGLLMNIFKEALAIINSSFFETVIFNAAFGLEISYQPYKDGGLEKQVLIRMINDFARIVFKYPELMETSDLLPSDVGVGYRISGYSLCDICIKKMEDASSS